MSMDTALRPGRQSVSIRTRNPVRRALGLGLLRLAARVLGDTLQPEGLLLDERGRPVEIRPEGQPHPRDSRPSSSSSGQAVDSTQGIGLAIRGRRPGA